MKSLPFRIALLLTIATHGMHACAQIRDAGRTDVRRYGSRQSGGVLQGTRLPDLDAYLADGTEVKLRELCNGAYTVLVAGCLTCPQFHRGYAEVEAASQDYSSKGVQFFYFYKSLRHPELNGYVEAQNMEERLLQLATARKVLGTTVSWIADTIDNQLRDKLRSGSNSMYLVSPQGNILFAADRLDGPSLRKALAEHVGETAHRTLASDLDLPRLPRPRQPENIDTETQVQRPDGLVIVSTTPQSALETYYVKLRAEADDALLETGTGRLFLGFYPDPIHGVHWNNLTEPMKYSLQLPEGVEATPLEANAKKGPGDRDVEPRQFWVDIESDSPGASFGLSMHYFGCTDTMCKALTQGYVVQLVPANMGSSTFGFNRGPRGSSGKQRGGRGQRRRAQNSTTGQDERR
ncbi:MAG: hypothetical protein AAGD07_16375 [Planctomycetota bacterium]